MNPKSDPPEPSQQNEEVGATPVTVMYCFPSDWQNIRCHRWCIDRLKTGFDCVVVLFNPKRDRFIGSITYAP